MSYLETPSGLILPAAFAAQAERPSDAPDYGEIATILDGRDITRGYVPPNRLMQPGDGLLQLKAAGDVAWYESLYSDPQVYAVFQQRQSAVTSREWEVIPGGERPIDAQAAEALEAQLKALRWDDVTEKMLFAVFYGYAVAEILWEKQDRLVGIKQIKVRKRQRFGWTPEGELRLRTVGNWDGEPLPDRKFWAFSTGADNDDDPYGVGLAHWLYWPVTFKRGGMRTWLRYLDKFAQPTTVGRYPRGTTPAQKTKLLAAVRAVQSASGLILPEGMAMELLEAARSGTVDHATLVARMDSAIAKVVLGQTMTSEDGSSRSQAQVHMDVREEITKADADLVCESANRTWIQWWCDYNYPGAAYPRVWRSMEDPEDLTQRAERDKAVAEATGYRPTLGYVTETYGGQWEISPGRSVAPGATDAPATPQQAAFAAGDPAEKTLPEQQADVLARTAAPATDDLIDEIREALFAADSLEAFQGQLTDIYGTDRARANRLQYARALGQALGAAHLGGRYEAGRGD